MSSDYMQATAATKAWDEVFDRLTCGWIVNKDHTDYEPYIDLDIIRLFFENSEAAFSKAEKQELPVVKPNLTTDLKTNISL